jgi:hypothetical protein
MVHRDRSSRSGRRIGLWRAQAVARLAWVSARARGGGSSLHCKERAPGRHHHHHAGTPERSSERDALAHFPASLAWPGVRAMRGFGLRIRRRRSQSVASRHALESTRTVVDTCIDVDVRISQVERGTRASIRPAAYCRGSPANGPRVARATSGGEMACKRIDSVGASALLGAVGAGWLEAGSRSPCLSRYGKLPANRWRLQG